MHRATLLLATAMLWSRPAAAAWDTSDLLLSPIHFVWTVPGNIENGYHGPRATGVQSKITGCCDGIVSLALASALAANPVSEVWLWTDAPWPDTKPLLEHPRLVLRHIDPHTLAADYPTIRDALTLEARGNAETPWLHRSVIFADLVRYLVLHRYGGTYLDADIFSFASWRELATNHSIPLDRPIMNMEPGSAKEGLDREALIVGPFRPVPQVYPYFIYSNGAMLNFPSRHWLLNRTLASIEAVHSVRGHFFNDFGPMYVTRQAMTAPPSLPPPYGMRMLRMDEGGPLNVPATPVTLNNFLRSSSPYPFIHLDFDKGDMHIHSVVHEALCLQLATLGLKSAGGYTCELVDGVVRASDWQPSADGTS